jgi:hypothetical protein
MTNEMQNAATGTVKGAVTEQLLEEAMERIEFHHIEDRPGPKGGPYVSPRDQVTEYMEKTVARDAEYVSLGSSSAGVNLNLTDKGRDEFIAGLSQAIRRVSARIENGEGLEGVESLVAPVNESSG